MAKDLSKNTQLQEIKKKKKSVSHHMSPHTHFVHGSSQSTRHSSENSSESFAWPVSYWFSHNTSFTTYCLIQYVLG